MSKLKNGIVNFKNYKLVDVSDLIEADWNYKEDDDNLLDKLIRNIERSGQVENVIVRRLPSGKMEVVNGNHRLQAFRKMGIPKIVAYDVGELSLVEAKRLAIETNETKFKVDNIRLAETMKNLLDEFDKDTLSETMPFTEDEIDNFDKLLEFDWGALDDAEVEKLEQNQNATVYCTLKAPYRLHVQWRDLIEELVEIEHPDNDNPSDMLKIKCVIDAMKLMRDQLKGESE